MAVSNLVTSFVHVAGWAQKPLSAPRNKLGHFRSMSSVATPTSSFPSSNAQESPDSLAVQKPHVPYKAPSTSHLPRIQHPDGAFDEMSTIPDPRRSIDPMRPGTAHSTPDRHPDLNDEVATLSTKLINAINHQTTLDDKLSATRHELEAAQSRIKELEEQNATQRDILAGDVWVRRSTLDQEKRAIHAKVLEERARTAEMEKAKKRIEQELENLTTALFEEANKMVIGAKEEAQIEHEVLQRKNEQLKAQLADAEDLLKSQQEQLHELKEVMEHMASEQDEQTNQTAPSSPGVARFDIQLDDRMTSDTASLSPHMESLPPAHPMSFHHLIQPILRVDINAYDDFVHLAHSSRRRQASRVSSGSIPSFSMSLGLGSSSSTASPSTTTAAGSAPQSPNTPASAGEAMAPIPNLKDTRFFKRALAEDIEPTLRLDAAPGLSWLARRSVLSAMTDGSLVVDPVPTHSGASYLMSLAKPQFHPCSMCGEARKDPIYLRNHRFRTSEVDSAQRYPLCKYCLNRVRSTCDYLAFLRMVKDGHWKAEDGDQEKAAWEECVRLREQMFWARIGGGVVPTAQFLEGYKSRRPSQDTSKLRNLSVDAASFIDKDKALPLEPEGEDDEPTPLAQCEQVDADSKDPHDAEPQQQQQQDETTTQVEVVEPADVIAAQPETPPAQTAQDETNSKRLSMSSSESSLGSVKRLSITIPTIFQ